MAHDAKFNPNPSSFVSVANNISVPEASKVAQRLKSTTRCVVAVSLATRYNESIQVAIRDVRHRRVILLSNSPLVKAYHVIVICS